MIHVNRAEKLPEFEEFTKKNKTTGWNEFSRPKGETHELYLNCRELLLAHQNGLSAYTEKDLGDKELHIDHYRKRDLFPELKFEWNNLIVDERNNDEYGAGHKDKIVKDKAEYELLINPVDEDPTDFLTYQINGEIIPKANLKESDKARAEFTIKAFNLNASSLKETRSVLSSIVRDYSCLDAQTIKGALASRGFTTFVDFLLENKCYLDYNNGAR